MEDRLRVIFEEWARDHYMVTKRLKDGYIYLDTDQCWKAVLACTQVALDEFGESRRMQSTANKGTQNGRSSD